MRAWSSQVRFLRTSKKERRYIMTNLENIKANNKLIEELISQGYRVAWNPGTNETEIFVKVSYSEIKRDCHGFVVGDIWQKVGHVNRKLAQAIIL